MTQVLDATYENGAFRPLRAQASTLKEGQSVRIIVESNTPAEILRQAANVFVGLSVDEVSEVEAIAFDRSSFFTQQPADG